jgi:hypothetical protein
MEMKILVELDRDLQGLELAARAGAPPWTFPLRPPLLGEGAFGFGVGVSLWHVGSSRLVASGWFL